MEIMQSRMPASSGSLLLSAFHSFLLPFLLLSFVLNIRPAIYRIVAIFELIEYRVYGYMMRVRDFGVFFQGYTPKTIAHVPPMKIMSNLSTVSTQNNRIIRDFMYMRRKEFILVAVADSVVCFSLLLRRLLVIHPIFTELDGREY